MNTTLYLSFVVYIIIGICGFIYYKKQRQHINPNINIQKILQSYTAKEINMLKYLGQHSKKNVYAKSTIVKRFIQHGIIYQAWGEYYLFPETIDALYRYDRIHHHAQKKVEEEKTKQQQKQQQNKQQYTSNSTPNIHISLQYFNIYTPNHKTVRRAYLTMCKKYHPDVVSENKRINATQKIQEINMHYQIICKYYGWR